MTSHGVGDGRSGLEPPERSRSPPSTSATSASTAAVDESLKTRAMDEAPIGITIADATQPGMPLVYANAAFERITGYRPEYAIGRNCRFLQGEATRSEPVERMRAAIRNGAATTVEIRNYRRDGELFWNEVTIAPLRDDEGRIVNYVGFQQDVTRRKRAERAAAERAARIERERTAQRRLLERLDGVVVDVTEAVTSASSRGGLEREVVDRIDRTYAGAWFSRYDPRTEEVVVSVAAGTTNGDGDRGRIPVDGTADGDPLAAAAAAALDERFVQTESVADAGDGTTAVAAIPIHYGDATYGVIGVYTRTDSGFASDEHAVLTALGRTVATGINAIESRRTLRGEEAFELGFGLADHPLVDVADVAGCTMRYLGAVSDRDSPSMLFETAADGAAIDVDALRSNGPDGVTVHSVLSTESEGAVIELSVDDPRLQALITEHGAELDAATVDGDTAYVSVAVAREALAQSLVAAVTERFDSAELLVYRRRERRGRTRPEFVAAVERDLTERQRAALVRAYTAGYFEWSRDVDGDDLAASMGVCRSTFHQHLRAAQRKLVGAFVDPDRADAPTAPGDPN
ncbi:PAS domain-containing protein [Halobaculum halobium]|uniref:PAS domain-containing protein n=1 Tax=Halobaculum halobium TaxID=3032281 RepID=A0ABD5T9U8_9EURY|nr:PAS domain-containing protein [Halobaculum sp. SYNS20]